MSGRRRAEVFAHAKINLVLELVGRRDDGYTDIATVFQAVDLADRLEIEYDPARSGIALTTTGIAPCPPAENLAFRAARAFADRFELPGGIAIVLHKEIPAGAGLGGGSSDAAATLAALSSLTGLGTARDLAALGAALGADVPYFLTGGCALGTGRGDELEPLPDLPQWACVLARAGRPLATAEVYRIARAGLTGRRDPPNISRFLRHLREMPPEPPPIWNDLLPAAASLEPRIPQLIGALAGAGGRSGMTGSGSTVFGLFADETAAAAAAAALRSTGDVPFVCCTTTRPR